MDLKSEEIVTHRGIKMKRWVAEKIGLVPTTIQRCLRALSDEFSNSPPHFLFAQDDLFRLFRSEEYMLPMSTSWTGGVTLEDLDGHKALAFWPFHLKGKT